MEYHQQHSSLFRRNNKVMTWLRYELPDFKGFFYGKFGRNRRHGNSSDFSYDTFSYALNFDDDHSRFDDQYPFRNFSSRLPPSPSPGSQTVVFSRQIAAIS